MKRPRAQAKVRSGKSDIPLLQAQIQAWNQERSGLTCGVSEEPSNDTETYLAMLRLHLARTWYSLRSPSLAATLVGSALTTCWDYGTVDTEGFYSSVSELRMSFPMTVSKILKYKQRSATVA